MKTKDIIVVDLDGTLANTDECRHFLLQEPKLWDEFYLAACSVSPLKHTIQVVNSLKAMGFKVVICSGRSDLVRSETIAWLEQHGVLFDELYMRPHGDHTPDDDLKKSWVVEKEWIEKDRILCVFEDRNRMVKMWRELGLPCFQVAEGDF